ncbi:hypothetical protein BJ875DRAFT_378319, partial [Amylocarpus encephaloides]
DSLRFKHSFEREASRTLPLLVYLSYLALEEIVHPSYLLSLEYLDYLDYLTPVPITLPSIIYVYKAIKREDNTINLFNISY